MASGAEKQTIKVGNRDGTGHLGETVAFTAEKLGTVDFSGGADSVGYGADSGGYTSTYYRLPDGTFRVLLESGNLSLLLPSDIEEGMKRGQRNNYTYGRMTLEEIKAEAKFDIGRGFEILMENHPETVRDRVRDID